MLQTCNVCQSDRVEPLWKLPSFPLTGIYQDEYNPASIINEYDQELQFCNDCTHAQLGNQIDPIFLYRDTYTHRTSESPISTSGNRFLLNYIKSTTHNIFFSQILEIGCNDLLLLESLTDRSKSLAGIDPIWPDGISVSDSGIRLWGGLAETSNYSELLTSKIDLIISAHTFEHITNPRQVFESLKEELSENCLLIIEVPSAERMLEQGRLDQIFNQHVNYYSIASLKKLVEPFGFRLRDITYNFSYWGGTQLLTFALSDEEFSIDSKRIINKEVYQQAIVNFKSSIENTSRQIENSHRPVYLYGAAQMLPSLMYHFSDSAKKNVTAIIDDNPSRQGRYFPNLEIKILPSQAIQDFSDSTIVISALDSARPILGQILKLNPRTIIIPNGLI